MNSINKYIELDLERLVDIYEPNLVYEDLRDHIVFSIVELAENISRQVIYYEKQDHNELDRRIDDILTSKTFGIPTMLALLGVIF